LVAKRASKQTPKKKAPHGLEKGWKSFGKQLKLLGVAAVVIFLVLQVYFPSKTYWDKRQEESSLSSKLTSTEKENKELETKIKYYKTKQGIQELAKDELQMVKENEELYSPILVKDADKKNSEEEK
jgi:cell division protein FtsL